MVEKRAHFLAEYDWIRTGLCFEPRGHDMMSGAILYPPTRRRLRHRLPVHRDLGCLPMCGHGTIGTVTMALERGLVTPREPGLLRIDTPAGVVEARYVQNGPYVESVRITNVASYPAFAGGITAEVEGLGELVVDVAYGGNFYAIVEPQKNFPGLEHVDPSDILRWSPRVRAAFREKYDFVHPENPAIRGLSPRAVDGHADAARGARPQRRLLRRQGHRPFALRHRHVGPHGAVGGARQAEGRATTSSTSRIIGTHVPRPRRARRRRSAAYDAIIPSIEGWARMTGYNTIFIDDRDPLAHGFQVKDRG